MSPEITQLIDALAKISAPVWESYIFQQKIYGFLSMLASAASIVFFFNIGRFKLRSGAEDDNIWQVAKFASVVLTVVFFGLGLSKIINPVYFAAQGLLGR